jgi:hypothetical protein
LFFGENGVSRKRDYDQFKAKRYGSRTKVCDNGHEGRVGKITGLCAGCLSDHLEQGKWDFGGLSPYSRSPVRPRKASGREDSPYPRVDITQDIDDAPGGLQRFEGQCVLVCGSRDWTDRLAIWDELFKRRVTTEIVIHGAARGADTLAGRVAHELGLPVHEYPADWDRYKPDPEYDPETGQRRGNPAGHIRNAQMLRDGQPDLVLAFGEGRGTDGMVKLAEKAGVPVIRVT